MTHTLVTFLGKSKEDKATGYRCANYKFPDGAAMKTPFFGLALAQHLHPDTVVILGTSGSQWGVLVEHLALVGDEEEKRLALLEAETRSTITQRMLDRVAPIMRRAIRFDVKPHLIPFGADGKEQYDILGAIDEAVPNGEVSFDLAHGFRHLGMIGFLSAFMLERVRNLTVRSLWYGALDMTDRESGVTPVLRLDGLTRVRGWVDALDRFDATGDYGVFAPLLIEDGVPEDKARCLEAASFHERTMNLSDAARKLTTFLLVLDERLGGASGLFQQRLSERLAWVRGTSLAQHQRKLAFEHLKRGDFLRAACFGWEAFVTLECEQRKLPADDFGAGRKPAIEQLEAELDKGEHPDWKASAFRLLRNIRNSLAHGNPPSHRRYQAILKDSNHLRVELEKAFQHLLSS